MEEEDARAGSSRNNGGFEMGFSRGGTQVPLFIKKFEIYITARITAPITAIIPAYIPAVITGRGDGH